MSEPRSDWGKHIERMFSGIVPWYDRLNRILSLRRDVGWRRALVRGLNLPPSPWVLDLAAGTLDVALELSRNFPLGKIVALDFSLAMLRQGQAKLAASPSPVSIALIAADAYALPFRDEQFNAVTMAFGIRNLLDRAAALTEIKRILQPGGQIAILEFVPPQTGYFLVLYRWYLHHILPLLGRLLSPLGFAYRYLVESIGAFPTASEFGRELQRADFEQVQSQPLTGGVAYLFYGRKPRAPR
ncbi:MAG: ubiquinone/menaquinone biosynthesis methyltransferase [Deltaproteobacteria bacterium]|nr:ubiquinone/menaquinone biosynthesis methyltransferase [Deltaproteobacteria bacterium]MBW1951564.1 ubiquinone/menaquinone biosynthesis methyltransferase [Deltaproteobacteria bacterium]MBW1986811.1 ubiquinone/menaquinone biosynthesis methyltransferase [Deltaproteobacteria bacterium]MBW2135231.1 ubiquinone/menaquinone biosynthesis methyltransferase [Deltaproteobacteria bacterium]